MRTDPIASVAKAEISASVSCAARDLRRTIRLSATSGRTRTGMAASDRAERLGLVTTIIVIAPTNMATLRSAIDAEEPTADLICVASAVRRETTSPDIVRSKKPDDSVITLAKTSARTSATTRSPSVVTR